MNNNLQFILGHHPYIHIYILLRSYVLFMLKHTIHWDIFCPYKHTSIILQVLSNERRSVP